MYVNIIKYNISLVKGKTSAVIIKVIKNKQEYQTKLVFLILTL